MTDKPYYHKVTEKDCLSVATKDEAARLSMITDLHLLNRLALLWCNLNRYKLGYYLGNSCWDATLIDK